MYLWWVQYVDDDWGCYIIAETRGKAKSYFWAEHNECDYTDIGARKIKSADGYKPQLLDDADDPILAELGVEYADVEE